MRARTTIIAGAITGAMLTGTTAVAVAGAEPGEAAEPVAFTSDFAWSHQPAFGEPITLDSGIERLVGQAWQFRNVESSDPRLAGTYTLTLTFDDYPGFDLTVGTERIEDEHGAWQEPADYWHTWDPQPGDVQQRILVGEGDYAGLIAIVDETWRPDGDSGLVDIRLEGFIIEGELPANPEPWSSR